MSTGLDFQTQWDTETRKAIQKNEPGKRKTVNDGDSGKLGAHNQSKDILKI